MRMITFSRDYYYYEGASWSSGGGGNGGSGGAALTAAGVGVRGEETESLTSRALGLRLSSNTSRLHLTWESSQCSPGFGLFIADVGRNYNKGPGR